MPEGRHPFRVPPFHEADGRGAAAGLSRRGARRCQRRTRARARVGGEVDRLTLLRGTASVNAGDERLLGDLHAGLVVVGVEVGLGRAVDVRVGAEPLLDDVHGHGDAVALGGHLEVLRADTEGDLLAGGAREPVALDGDLGAAHGHAAVDHLHVEQVHRRGADEAGHEHVVRVVVHPARGVALHQQAVLEHRHAVAHRHGLDLVVGDVDRGDAEATLQRGDLGAGLHAQLGVEVRQRLVHEEDLRLADDRAAHGHALALPTGEGLRLALEVGLEVEDLGGLLDALVDLGLVHAGDLQGEAHVVGHRHVRVERVVLEDHGNVTVLGGEVGDIAVADPDPALVDLLEAREHAERGGLAAPGRADEDEELTVFDVDVQLVDRGLVVARVDAGCLVELDCCHGVFAFPSPAGTCRTIRCKGWFSAGVGARGGVSLTHAGGFGHRRPRRGEGPACLCTPLQELPNRCKNLHAHGPAGLQVLAIFPSTVRAARVRPAHNKENSCTSVPLAQRP